MGRERRGTKFSQCCASAGYGSSFFGLHNELLPRMTLAQGDTGWAEIRPNFKVYTAENVLMLLLHCHPREIHLLFRFLTIVRPWAGTAIVVPPQLAERWLSVFPQGLEDEEPPCESSCEDNGKKHYLEVGVHGTWSWKHPRHVRYICLDSQGKHAGANRQRFFAEPVLPVIE